MITGDTTYLALATTLALVILRVAGIFIAAPIFASAAVPVRLRVLIAIVIGLAVAGRATAPAALPTSVIGLILAAAGELAIGAVVGYAAQLIFAGVEVGAFYVSQQMGLSLAEVVDPVTQAPSDPIRSFYNLLAVVIFLAIGGHRQMIGSLLASFDFVPLMGLTVGGGLPATAAGLLSASFVLALKLAGPVLAAMLLATAAMAILEKAIPQCNFLTTGLPARAILGLVVVAAAVGVVAPLLGTAADLMMRNVPAMLAGSR